MGGWRGSERSEPYVRSHFPSNYYECPEFDLYMAMKFIHYTSGVVCLIIAYKYNIIFVDEPFL